MAVKREEVLKAATPNDRMIKLNLELEKRGCERYSTVCKLSIHQAARRCLQHGQLDELVPRKAYKFTAYLRRIRLLSDFLDKFSGRCK